MANRMDSLYVDGTLGCTTLSVPSGFVLPGTQYVRSLRFTHYQAGTAADETKILNVGLGASGTIRKFSVVNEVKCIGDSTVTVDLKKNGTTVLSAPITLNSSTTINTVISATISSPTYAAGDRLAVVIDATAGTGTLATGIAVVLHVLEDVES
jgi:hypothetical protein